MKKVMITVAALLLACLGLSVTGESASAHQPHITATCDGVHLTAVDYEAGHANTWTVTIAGVTQSGTFDTTFDQTFPVPQGGATTPWSARIAGYDGNYDSGVVSGTVGPCGESDDVCGDLPGNQPPGTACTPPPTPALRSAEGRMLGCNVRFEGRPFGAGLLIFKRAFQDTYVFNATTNVWDLVPDTTGHITSLEFTRWSEDRKIREGSVQPHTPHNPGPPNSTHAASTPSTPAVAPIQASTAVPTAVDAGL